MIPITVIAGPTASGKTRLAIQLAKASHGEIISADSQQVYRGMDIGTAKPTRTEQQEVRHHVIDVVDPDEDFHVGKYVQLADQAIADVAARGKQVLVVGGTGLYISTLLYGLCQAPPRDETVRARLEKQPLDELYRRLIAVDPLSRGSIHPHHRTRIIRALEVVELTGRPLSWWISEQKKEIRYDACLWALQTDRQELYRRIDDRVHQMISRGWYDEVNRLVDTYGPHCRAFSAVGYREMLSVREGRCSLIDAVQMIQQRTRSYAKRQITWLKAMKNVRWGTPEKIEAEAPYRFSRS